MIVNTIKQVNYSPVAKKTKDGNISKSQIKGTNTVSRLSFGRGNRGYSTQGEYPAKEVSHEGVSKESFNKLKHAHEQLALVVKSSMDHLYSNIKFMRADARKQDERIKKMEAQIVELRTSIQQLYS